jgi:hypothetical protein
LISKKTGGNQYATKKPESKVDFRAREEIAITEDCKRAEVASEKHSARTFY